MKHDFTYQLIREPLKAKSDTWQETAFKWLITINGVEFDYHTSIGHIEPRKNLWDNQRKNFKYLKNAKLTDSGLKELLALSRPIPPSYDNVIECLLSDAQLGSESFEDFCDNLGYDVDSRKALDIYLQCQEAAGKLRKAKINIEEEQKRIDALNS